MVDGDGPEYVSVSPPVVTYGAPVTLVGRIASFRLDHDAFVLDPIPGCGLTEGDRFVLRHSDVRGTYFRTGIGTVRRVENGTEVVCDATEVVARAVGDCVYRVGATTITAAPPPAVPAPRQRLRLAHAAAWQASKRVHELEAFLAEQAVCIAALDHKDLDNGTAQAIAKDFRAMAGKAHAWELDPEIDWTGIEGAPR